jgi:hypothetical protein
MKVVPQTDPQAPNGLKPSQLTILSQMSGGAFTHSIWRGDQRVATDIASLEDAQTMSAAPELLEFAQTILKQSRADTAKSLPEIVYVCQQITATEEGMVDIAGAALPAMLTSWPSPRQPSYGPLAAAKLEPPDSPAPLFDEMFTLTVRQIRKEATDAGWTLQRLAGELGMSRAQFSRWEKSIPKTVQAVTKLQTAVRAGPATVAQGVRN